WRAPTDLALYRSCQPALPIGLYQQQKVGHSQASRGKNPQDPGKLRSPGPFPRTYSPPAPWLLICFSTYRRLPMNRPLLVPLDGNPESETVLSEVQRGSGLRDDVHFLHVVPILHA